MPVVEVLCLFVCLYVMKYKTCRLVAEFQWKNAIQNEAVHIHHVAEVSFGIPMLLWCFNCKIFTIPMRSTVPIPFSTQRITVISRFYFSISMAVRCCCRNAKESLVTHACFALFRFVVFFSSLLTGVKTTKLKWCKFINSSDGFTAQALCDASN